MDYDVLHFNNFYPFLIVNSTKFVFESSSIPHLFGTFQWVTANLTRSNYHSYYNAIYLYPIKKTSSLNISLSIDYLDMKGFKANPPAATKREPRSRCTR